MGKDQFIQTLFALLDQCEKAECLEDGVGFTVVWICHLSCWQHPKMEEIIGRTAIPYEAAGVVLTFVRRNYQIAFDYQDVLHQVCQHLLFHGHIELAMHVSALVKSRAWLPPDAPR